MAPRPADNADGTINVRTDDSDPYLAEARAADAKQAHMAIALFREQGCPRPVVIVVPEGVPFTVPPDSISFANRGFPGPTQTHVTRPDHARQALRPIFGAQAARLFRVSSWPAGYFTVSLLRGGGAEVYESRSWADAREDTPPS
jgi:hypothetical protein